MKRVEIVKSSDLFTNNVPICIDHYVYDRYEALCLHTHEFIEIVYICRGKGVHVVNDGVYPVSKGDLFIINFDTPHSFFPNDPENTDHLEVYNCMFMPEFIEHLQIELPILKEIVGIFLLNGLYPEERTYSPDLKLGSDSVFYDFQSIFSKMYEEFTHKQTGYVDILKMQLCELLIKIHRKSRQQANPNAYKLELIHKSIQYLKDNYANPIHLTEVSQHAFLSKSYFSSLFKKTTGMSVFDYLQKIRIDEACRLLIDSSATITSISEKVGYKDYRFFNKIFRKITGMTAQEYRKRNSA